MLVRMQRALLLAVVMTCLLSACGPTPFAPAEADPLALEIPGYPTETQWSREEGEGPPYHANLRYRLEPNGKLFLCLEEWADGLAKLPLSDEFSLLAEGVVQADTFGDHLIFLTADGTVWTFGSNLYGQLGTGTEGDVISSPVPVLEDCVAVATDHFVSAALKANGDLYTWGDNVNGLVGNGETGYVEPIDPSWANPQHKRELTPVCILQDIISVDFVTDQQGRTNGCALEKSGLTYYWGESYTPTPEPYYEG